jgi:hypothetical protein
MSLTSHKVLGDHRGQLVALESKRTVPFDIKRVFYIYGTQPDLSRGNHAHFKTRQYLIAVSGSCKVTLDNGSSKVVYDLNSPEKGLDQAALIWGIMHDFSEDCVLPVMADDYYDPSDYINDYQDFLNVVNKKDVLATLW